MKREIKENQVWEMKNTSRIGREKFWTVTFVEGDGLGKYNDVALVCELTNEQKVIEAQTLWKSYEPSYYDPETHEIEEEQVKDEPAFSELAEAMHEALQNYAEERVEKILDDIEKDVCGAPFDIEEQYRGILIDLLEERI